MSDKHDKKHNKQNFSNKDSQHSKETAPAFRPDQDKQQLNKDSLKNARGGALDETITEFEKNKKKSFGTDVTFPK